MKTKDINPKLVNQGKYYNIYKSTLICQNQSSHREPIYRYYKSQSGLYFRTAIGFYHLNPTREDEVFSIETDFDGTRRIIEACRSKAPFFAGSTIFEIPEEFNEIKEV